jgi:hypothetical protein
VAGRPQRQNATGNARAELLAIVRATRPWGGSKLKAQLRELSEAHGWEAATPDRIDAVISTFREWLRDEPGGRIDANIDDETARDAIWTMLGNAMRGRDPLDTDLLADTVSGPVLDRIPPRTRQHWRAESIDGGLSLFMKRYQRRASRAYLEGTLGLTATAARAWLRRHPDENPTTARPVSRDHVEWMSRTGP